MHLVRVPEAFDNSDWIFEPKLDGFRALAIVRGHRCELVSRNGRRSTGAILVSQRPSASSSRCQRSASRRLRFKPKTSARAPPPTIQAIIAKNTGVCANLALE
jgi:hypothetical protein